MDNREFEIEQFENGGNEKETIDAIRDIISPEAKCIPQDTDSGWLCCCERFNMPELNICSNCGASKTEIFKINDNAFISEILEKHQKNEEERERRAQQEAKAKEKAKRSKDIKISVGFILGIIATSFIVYAVTISSRTTYSSEEEMKSALQGTYTFYDASGKASRQIVIEGDTATYIYLYSSDESEIEIRKWDYKQGVIHTFEDLIVTNEGYLKHGNDIYKKSRYMSSSYSSSYDYESAYSVLDITVDRVSNNSSYTVCTGSVKNTGKKTYRYIKVKGSFKDSSGNVLDTDWTYAAGSEGLSPGESTTFRLSVPQNLKITSCSVSLFDYN